MESLKRELLFEIQRCAELFNSKVFINQSVFTQSAFIELLIRLEYILKKLDCEKHRINWAENIQTGKKIKDITDLVNNLRNAACHIESKENYIEGTSIKFVFNIFVGKCPSAIQTSNNRALGNDYEDDIAFYYGDKRIYLIRHIKKLLEELPIAISHL